MKILRLSSKELQKICSRVYCNKKRIEEKVRRIVEEVHLNGDEALLKFTKKFDGVKLTAKDLRVSESEINGAYQNIEPAFFDILKAIFENIERFYKKELKKPWRVKDGDGAELGRLFRPIEKVGIYIPSGTAPLVSTVYMTVLPAKLAGVERIVIASPPNKSCQIDSNILVVANILKVSEIYKMGGAQAIAALAFGTKTVPRVDKIVGPGNAYVTEAKRQVFGYADIDMLAGPSEVVIIANQFSNPKFVIEDLRAQSEHSGGLSILITTSRRFANLIKKEVERGYIILARNLDHAVEIANSIAPEHLEILTNKPKRLLKKIKNAGAVFLGPYSPTAIGDYWAGPSHVLPTCGTARFFSGLGVKDFIKTTHFVSYSKKALDKARQSIEKLTSLEKLPRHFESVKVRFD